jgi:predicted GIY-YIG superfamily endonuclease
MTDDEELEALYRYWGEGKRQPPLYIGRSKNVMRRSEQHRASKEWITLATRIDVEWYTPEQIAEAERQAIQRERPVYNIQHNGGRVRIEAEVTFSPPSPESLAAMLALIVAGGMAAVWAADSIANWNVRRRAERAGQQVELPPARNLFAQDPQHWSANLLTALMKAATLTAADLEERKAMAARMSALAQGQ